MSKEIVVIGGEDVLAVRPGSRRIDHKKFARDKCVTATPFGRPVEPEV